MSYLKQKLRNPLGLLYRAFWKVLVGPFKYRGKDGYDAERYWTDRHARFGVGYRGSGDEGLSEAENEKIYEAETNEFARIAERHRSSLKGRKALDIGCGAGIYAGLASHEEVAHYTGVDITEVLFPGLKDKFPTYTFVRADAGTDDLEEVVGSGYDVILCISVIIHVTRRHRLQRLIDNCLSCLAPDGVFFLSPVSTQDRKHFFYNSSWSLGTVARSMPGLHFSMEPYRGGYMLVVRKQLPG